ncbi:MAG TPA: cell wall-binding repeat-containing protein [Candidatus Limnocylindria bacterium]|nr:cell wall-binding repeat-containing protein [Candidatus Limnocylindria bacterium]
MTANTVSPCPVLPRFSRLAALAGILAVAAAAITAAPAAAVGGDVYVELANEKRASVGRAAVTLSAATDRIAVERADQMAAGDEFEHDMAYVEARLKQLGVCFSTYGEIIAWEKGYSSYSYARTVDAWWASPGHHAIMVGDYNAAGGSWAKSTKSGVIYSVMIFVKLCAAPTASATVSRITGVDRYAGAANLSAVTFAAGRPVAYVVSGEGFADALAAGAAAARADAPLLLVRYGGVPAATANELGRLRPGRIVVVGGPGTVSDAVLAELARYTAGGVTRITGADRYAGAANLSAVTFPAGLPVAYVTTGENYPDALAASGAAGLNGAPILLTKRDGLPRATANELTRLRPGRIVVLGGSGSVSDAVVAALSRYSGSVSRITAPDRYAGAVALSRISFASARTVYVATGANFPDGLGAGAVAGGLPGPLLLVPTDWLPTSVAEELRRLGPTRVVVVGGPGSVSDGVLSAIDAALP